ncbi:MAG: hypothetical protein ACUVSQ_04240 [Pseudanabaenaceae cyanobacterium]
MSHAANPNPHPWQVKATARAEGGTVSLEMVVGPIAPKREELPPLPDSVPEPIAPRAAEIPLAPAPIAPPADPVPPEVLWEENPEGAAEQPPPPLPSPETVQTVRVAPLRRFFGNVPVWQWLFWLAVMAIAVGGGLRFGRWVVRRLSNFQTDQAVTAPVSPAPAAAPPALLTLTNARPTTTWQIGRGRLDRYEFRVPYATAHLAIVTGRTNVDKIAQQLLTKRWFGSGRFEPEAGRSQRLPVTVCGQNLDNTREEGRYRIDTAALPAIRDRLILPRGDRQQVVTIVAYGRNPPRLADELLKSLACR